MSGAAKPFLVAELDDGGILKPSHPQLDGALFLRCPGGLVACRAAVRNRGGPPALKISGSMTAGRVTRQGSCKRERFAQLILAAAATARELDGGFNSTAFLSSASP